MNDGVVEDKNLKATPFNLSSGSIQNFNQTTKTPFNNNNNNLFNNQGTNKPRPFFNSNQRKKFTPMGEPLENSLRTLVSNKLLILSNSSPYEPKFKPSWWNDAHHCEYHRNKGHKTNESMKLKHMV